MQDKQFIEDAIRTESPNFFQPNVRILHAAIGCVTESGELLDALKKQIFYGRELDVVNVKEEAGDILWYEGHMEIYMGGNNTFGAFRPSKPAGYATGINRFVKAYRIDF